MLEYDRIDILEGIDINKTNKSKECILCHYWYFLDKNFTYALTKSRNILTNILYTGMKEEDLFDRSFVFDVYVLTTKTLIRFSLERKIFDIKIERW